MARQRTAAVVGAGAFGAATARELARRGWDVNLVEQHAPGHVRGSSGGESRLIRFGHGTDAWYTRSAWRARELWTQLEEDTGTDLLVRCGVAWFARTTDGWEADSATALEAEDIPVRRLSTEAATGLFPDLATDDIEWVLYEPAAGVLRARRAVQALVADATARGVRLAAEHAQPDGPLPVVGGERLAVDRVVWACGPWLAALFPDLIELRVTQQDECYYGPPPGDAWSSPPVPAWVDYDGAAYGVGDLDGLGLKCNSDVEGPPVEPSALVRVPLEDFTTRSREILRARFPSLADAPLVGTRTCQYELTADAHFVAAPHPDDPNAFVVGGGSGHGFKHAPAFAEHVADLVEGEAAPIERFRLGPRSPGRALRTAGGAG